jgi:hypothetical protein
MSKFFYATALACFVAALACGGWELPLVGACNLIVAFAWDWIGATARRAD